AGNEEIACFDIGLCNGWGPDNQCQSWVTKAQASMSIDVLERDRDDLLGVVPQQYGLSKEGLTNITGYAKAGPLLINSTSTPEGYFPYATMRQYGEFAVVPNGSFETFGENGYPIGWSFGRINTGDGTFN